MNINFVYDNFDISGKNHANLEYSFNNRTWFDSSNFFSSYLNDSESGFDYWHDKERFQIRKHPLESILNKPNDVYFYMIGESVEAAQYYYEEDDKVERASKSQIYFHIDKGELMIYYGSSRRRKRRPLSKLDNSFI